MSEKYTQLALFTYTEEIFFVGERLCVQTTCTAWDGHILFISFRYF